MAASEIHPLALVEEGARLGEGVRVGPFCHVGGEAVIGEGSVLESHVTIAGPTTVGARCHIHANAVLGGPPQSVRHKGGRTTLKVGSGCVIRESATLSLGSDTARGETTIGDNCFLMALSHVGHDCVIGNNVTLVNGVALGGHVEIGDHAMLGGLAAVHQFVRIGHHAFVGGLAAVAGDVIPYGMAVGDRATLRGLNIIGMRRSGMAKADIHSVRAAYRLIFDPQRSFADGLEQARARYGDFSPVADILAFIGERGRRAFALPPARAGGQPGAASDDEA